MQGGIPGGVVFTYSHKRILTHVILKIRHAGHISADRILLLEVFC